MRTKVAIFKYVASVARWKENGGGEQIDVELIESGINEFCEDKDIVDIKVNTVDHDYHNNGGSNGITLVYTVIYRENI